VSCLGESLKKCSEAWMARPVVTGFKRFHGWTNRRLRRLGGPFSGFPRGSVQSGVATPAVEFGDPFEQAFGHMRTLPLPRGILVRLVVPRILFNPRPCLIASTYSAIKSPECSPTIVTPRIRSLPGTVSTLTKHGRGHQYRSGLPRI
jgi:hypothetical protein